MFKKLTLMTLAALAVSLGANAEDQFTLNWKHVIDGGTAGENILNVEKSSDDLLLVATTFGTSTTKSSLTVKMDGTNIKGLDGEDIQGSPYTGNGYNVNYMLQKVNPSDGSINWFAYTRKGDMAEPAYCHTLATNDGGAMAVLKVRAWQQLAGYDNLLEVVDGTGQVTTIKDMNTQASEYRYLIIRFDTNGKLQWTRLISGYVHPIDKSEGGTYSQASKNNFYVYGFTLDADQNIYLTGNFRTQLNVKDSKGNIITLTAKNNAGWTGDSQKVLGDMFLLKLDKDGYYVNSLVAEGTASCAFMDKVVYNDGTLYLNGRVKADTTTLKLDGQEIKASSSYQTTFIAAVNASDLKVKTLNVLTSVPNGSSFVNQNKAAQYIDGKLYFTGGIRGSWSQDGVSLCETTTANTGYTMQVDPATLKVLHVTTHSSTFNQFGVFLKGDSIYSFGDGILYTMDPATFKWTTKRTMSKWGFTLICTTPVVMGDNVIFANRGSGTPTYYNDATDYSALSTTTFANTYYSYKMTSGASAIKGVTENTGTDNYDVYTTSGVKLRQATSMKEATLNLQPGLYIVGGEKVVVE